MKFQWFFFAFFLVLTVSCRKQVIKPEGSRLPKATQKGRGIFACHVGDRTYIARKQNTIIYNQTDGYLNLENEYVNRYFRLFVYEGLFSEGIYAFDSTGEEYIYEQTSFGVRSGELNRLEITKLDVGNRIVSGVFDLDVFSEKDKKIEIRDGRFDLKMAITN